MARGRAAQILDMRELARCPKGAVNGLAAPLSTLDLVVPDAAQPNARRTPIPKSYFGAGGIAWE